MRLRVLFVEDSPTDAELTVLLLRRTPAPAPEVQVVGTLREALQQLSAVPFDVILSDLYLPDSEGLDTIRALVAAGAPPIVAYTGKLAPEQGILAIQAGADDFMAKGVDGLRLRLVLEQAVARRRRDGAPRPPTVRLAEIALDRTTALADSAGFLRLATVGLEEVIFLAEDEPRRVVFVSEGYGTLYGRNPEALFADPADWLTAVHPDDQSRVEGILSTAPSEMPERFRFRLLHPTLGERWLEANVVLAKEPNGAPRHWAGVVRDVTDSVRGAEARRDLIEHQGRLQVVEKANRFKAEFLNMAAHELSNPLTPVLLQLASLRVVAGAVKDERLSAALQVMERNVTRLGGLVQDLLEAGRLQAGTIAFHWVETDLSSLCKQAVAGIRPLAERDGVALTVRTPRTLPARIDPERFSVVLLNLLSNAVKYTPRGGSATLSLSAEADHATVVVADTGRGIRPEEQPRLFQPFVRLGDTASVKGTGLGLYISKALVEAHGGTLSCASEGDGLGSTFTVRVPLEAPTPAGIARSSSPSPRSN